MKFTAKVKDLLLISTIIFLFLVAAVFCFLYLKNKKLDDKSIIINEVSKIVVLPEEEPELMEVASEDVIKTQPFFKRAEVGDKVLVYMEENTAILYSPKKHKIVNMGTLRLDRDPQGIDTNIR